MTTANVIKQCESISKALGVRYALRKQDISYAEVFASQGLLPAIARKADQLCILCFGYGIGATFQNNKEARLGIEVEFDALTPDIIRLPCLTNVLVDLSRSAEENVVTLDALLMD